MRDIGEPLVGKYVAQFVWRSAIVHREIVVHVLVLVPRLVVIPVPLDQENSAAWLNDPLPLSERRSGIGERPDEMASSDQFDGIVW